MSIFQCFTHVGDMLHQAEWTAMQNFALVVAGVRVWNPINCEKKELWKYILSEGTYPLHDSYEILGCMGVTVPLSRVQFSRFHSQQVCKF